MQYLVLRMKLRLIDIDYPDDPYRNLAVDEAIFLEVMSGNSPPTFRFYKNSNAVIIGCFQLAEQEVDMNYAVQNDIKIAKRFTGGGAVYHDMGDLNYSIITKDSFEIGTNVQKLFSTMIRGALTSFKELGIDAVSGGLNDVSVNNKKILGAAATLRSNTVLFHAAVLVNTNLQTLSSVLKVPGIKLKDKRASTILERVANIQTISGNNVDQVRRAILDGYSKELGFEYNVDELTEREIRLINRLYKEKYTNPDWNLGREFISINP
jgi:lipoate---protein ligase